MDEAELQDKEADKKTFEMHGCKFVIQNRSTYDFSQCGDSQLDHLNKKSDLLKEEIKGRERFLINLKDSFTDESTGEIIYPPAKSTTTTVAVILK